MQQPAWSRLVLETSTILDIRGSLYSIKQAILPLFIVPFVLIIIYHGCALVLLPRLSGCDKRYTDHPTTGMTPKGRSWLALRPGNWPGIKCNGGERPLALVSGSPDPPTLILFVAVCAPLTLHYQLFGQARCVPKIRSFMQPSKHMKMQYRHTGSSTPRDARSRDCIPLLL